MLPSLYQYRNFIWRNAMHDFRHRYAGSSMGALWNVMHPLAMIAIYAIVFTSIMSPRLPGTDSRFGYIIYLCSGIIPWTAFADCVSRGCSSLVLNASYLKKLPIPEPVFVAQEAVAAFVTAMISFVILFVFGLCVGMKPATTWLLVPLPVIALLALGFAIGMLLSTINVFFRDVQQWVGIVLQILMWTAPVVYVVDILPPQLQAVLKFHPLVPPLLAIRELFVYATWPPAWQWIAMLAWPAAFGVAALAVTNALASASSMISTEIPFSRSIV